MHGKQQKGFAYFSVQYPLPSILPCMQRLFIALCFLLLPSLAHANDRYLVFFKYKGHHYNLEHADKFLSQKSLDRRSKYHIAIDSTDLPVHPQHLDQLQQLGCEVLYTSRWLNAAYVSAPTQLLEQIRGLPTVKHIASLVEKPQYWNINQVGSSPTAHASSAPPPSLPQYSMLGIPEMHAQGIKGLGIYVAVMDAGFLGYRQHALFKHLDVADEYDFVDKEIDTADDHLHGLQVLSVMAAKGDQLTGCAPEATYMLYRTENNSKESREEELLWLFAAERADSLGADIIQSSLGYYDFDNPEENYAWKDLDGKSAWISLAANQAARKGILIICSAGNEGMQPWKKIVFPADSPHVLAVGSVSTQGSRSYFSSIGPSADGRIKPDVMGMGQGTIVAKAQEGTTSAQGTSFASPALAGLATGLLQYSPHATPDEIMQAIRICGDRAQSPDNEYGYGVPSFLKALALLENSTPPQEISDIRLYPNPFSDTFFLDSIPSSLLGTEISLHVYTADGKLLEQQSHTITSTKQLIDLKHLHISGKALIIELQGDGHKKVFRTIAF